VHNAHVAEFAGEGFAPGDVIGVWFVLPADLALSGTAALARLKEDKERDEAEKARKGRTRRAGAPSNMPTKRYWRVAKTPQLPLLP
jgi:hypothetical protein